MQVVHRDLKPGNIVLEKDYHVKLIDFGTCKVFQPKLSEAISQFMKQNADKNPFYDTERMFSLVGTEDYIAPEVLED